MPDRDTHRIGRWQFVGKVSVGRAKPLEANYFYFQDCSIADIYQMRKVLEPELVACLAGNLTEGGSRMLDPITMGTNIQADLNAAGFTVSIEIYEWNTFLGKVNPGLEGKAEMAWMSNTPETLPFLALCTEAWPDKVGFNSEYYSNPKVDDLLKTARASTDQAERAKLYQEMQVIVQEDAPWVFVASWKQNAETSERAEGFSLWPSFFLLLDDVEKS